MKRKIITIGSLLICLLIKTGCTDKFEDMNTNPLTPSAVNPELVFPYVCKEMPNLRWDAYQCGDNLGANLFAQYIANTSSNFAHDRYVYNSGHVEFGYWTPHFVYITKNIKLVGQNLDKYPYSVQTYQLMRIIYAISSAKMTDLFGDIPYFEAGIGIEKPKYDSQKAIYYDIFKELTEAVNTLQSDLKGQATLDNSDFIYGGNITNWIKLANSMRLRYAIRLSFIDPEKAKSEGEAALAAGVMESIEDGALSVTNHKDWDNLGYPLITISHWNEYRVSETMINTMTSLSSVYDPRLPVWFGKTRNYVKNNQGPEFKGVPNGLPSDELTQPGNSVDENSNVYGLAFMPKWNSEGVEPQGGDWISKKFPVMNYSEVCFLKAEAALRNWNNAGNAAQNYEDGIRSSFAEARQDIPVGLLDFTKDNQYIQTGNVKWEESDDFETKLEKVITQKWIALFPNGNEAWTEFRRTGYPRLTPVRRSDDPLIKPENGEFIKKFQYTDLEKRVNTENSTSMSLNNGKGDGSNVRVWWDTSRYK